MIPGLIATWILAPGALLVAWTHWREHRRINDLPLASRKEK